MAAQTIKLAGKKFVILPESEYLALRDQSSTGRRNGRGSRRPTAQDVGDVAEAKRRLREPTTPLSAVRKRLGL